MDDITLHGSTEIPDRRTNNIAMGQYTYNDDMFSPRWKAWQAYAVHETEKNAPTRGLPQRPSNPSNKLLGVLILLGTFIFLCSTASLAVLVMLLDTTNSHFEEFSKIKLTLDSVANIGQILLNRSDASWGAGFDP
jgi:hypothetical protein